jgi:hypothetical protein
MVVARSWLMYILDATALVIVVKALVESLSSQQPSLSSQQEECKHETKQLAFDAVTQTPKDETEAEFLQREHALKQELAGTRRALTAEQEARADAEAIIHELKGQLLNARDRLRERETQFDRQTQRFERTVLQLHKLSKHAGSCSGSERLATFDEGRHEDSIPEESSQRSEASLSTAEEVSSEAASSLAEEPIS